MNVRRTISLVTAVWTLITDSLKFRCKMASNVGDTPCLQNWSGSDRNPGRWLAGSPSGARSPPSVWLVGQVGDHSGWMALTSQATGSSPMTVPWLLPYRHQVTGASGLCCHIHETHSGSDTIITLLSLVVDPSGSKPGSQRKRRHPSTPFQLDTGGSIGSCCSWAVDTSLQVVTLDLPNNNRHCASLRWSRVTSCIAVTAGICITKELKIEHW